MCSLLCVSLVSGCKKGARSGGELDTSGLKGLGKGKGVSSEDVSKAKQKAEGYQQPSSK